MTEIKLMLALTIRDFDFKDAQLHSHQSKLVV
jgi:hypothetical protein